MKKNQKNIFATVTRTLIVLSGIILWEITAKRGLYNTFYTSYPSEIINDLIEFYKSGELIRHTSITLKEAFLGLFYGTTLGIMFGVLFSQFKTLGKIFTPIISAINGIPQLTLAPVYILWFGIGLISKVFLSGLMVFFNVFFATYNAIKNIDQKLIESASLLGANSTEILWYIVIPTSFPWIISGIRLGVGVCMIGAIIGEYMGSSGGLGWMVTYAASFFQVRRIMSCILILLVVGLSLNWIFDKIENYLLRWRVETKISINNSKRK